MVSFWEVLDRAINTGPRMETKEFDMQIFKNANEFVKEYDIRYDPDNPVPNDDSLADDLFEAGLRLYLETGTYCMGSQRAIRFSEDEIKEALRGVPSEILIGEGAEAKWLKRREVEDRREPLNIGGVIESNPQEGDMFVKLYQSIAQERVVDGFYFGPSFTIEGVKWRTGSPLEIHAGRCAAAWAREAIRRVGKPGLHLISACPSGVADIASCDPVNGVRPSDAIAIPTTTELKIDYDSLSKVAFSIDYGCHRNPYWLPMIGGYAGGPEGAAVTGVAGAFHSLLVCQTALSGYNDISATYFGPSGKISVHSETHRNTTWVTALVLQSLARNTRLINGRGATTVAGPGTEMMLLETASSTISAVVSGGHIFQGIRKAILVKPNQASGLEPRFQGEVAKASATLKRSDANEIVCTLLSRFEGKFFEAPAGGSFEELYDLKTLTPKKEYVEIYNEVKEDLEDLGLSFS
jgi:methylamine--corrinoid protein Co-methyltransferase